MATNNVAGWDTMDKKWNPIPRTGIYSWVLNIPLVLSGSLQGMLLYQGLIGGFSYTGSEAAIARLFL